MGSVAGSDGLIDNEENRRKVIYEAWLGCLRPHAPSRLARPVGQPRSAGPKGRPTSFLNASNACVALGPGAAKEQLLAQQGRDAKIAFLRSSPGIGNKHARNIMMDVYHEDFRDSIAVDARIKKISAASALPSFRMPNTKHFTSKSRVRRNQRLGT